MRSKNFTLKKSPGSCPHSREKKLTSGRVMLLRLVPCFDDISSEDGIINPGQKWRRVIQAGPVLTMVCAV